MTLDRASQWRKGRDGYANKRKPVVPVEVLAPERAWPSPADLIVEEVGRRLRHGRAGALYCGGDK